MKNHLQHMAAFLATALAAGGPVFAQAATTPHIEGATAQRLVSLLASGSPEVFDKLDADDSTHRVDRRQAWGKINGSSVSTQIHEATSLSTAGSMRQSTKP